MHLIYLKGYTNFTLQNQSAVKGQKLGLCLQSFVINIFDNVIGFPNTYLLDNDLFIQLHSVEYKQHP